MYTTQLAVDGEMALDSVLITRAIRCVVTTKRIRDKLCQSISNAKLHKDHLKCVVTTKRVRDKLCLSVKSEIN